MSEVDMLDLSQLYSRQFGGTSDAILQTMQDWGSKLRNVMLDDARKALMEMAASPDSPTRPAARIAKLITMCLGTPVFLKKNSDVHNYPECAECNKCGFVEVPHPRDYTIDQFWNGEHICVVACRCEAGQRYATSHVTIINYEGRFPNWKQEYPLRRLEWRVKNNRPYAERDLEKFFQQQDEREGSNVSQQGQEDQPARGDHSEEAVCPEEDRQGDFLASGSDGREEAE